MDPDRGDVTGMFFDDREGAGSTAGPLTLYGIVCSVSKETQDFMLCASFHCRFVIHGSFVLGR